MRWLGHSAHARDKRNVYIFLVGKTKGKRSIGWPRLTKDNNIKVSMEERGLDSAGTGHTKLAVSCKFGNKLPDYIKYGIFFLYSCLSNKFSKRIRYFSIQRMQSYMPFENFKLKKNYASFCMKVPVLTPVLGWKVFVPRCMRYLMLEVFQFGSTPFLILVFITLTRFSNNSSKILGDDWDETWDFSNTKLVG